MDFNLTNNNSTLTDVIIEDGYKLPEEARQAIIIVIIIITIMAILIYICCLSAKERCCVCLYCYASGQVIPS